jgi:hypothetical protein
VDGTHNGFKSLAAASIAAHEEGRRVAKQAEAVAKRTAEVMATGPRAAAGGRQSRAGERSSRASARSSTRSTAASARRMTQGHCPTPYLRLAVRGARPAARA